MKYCLNSNVGPALLNEADEIAITKEDFGSVYMIAGRYPNATMIVPEPVDEFDWEGLKALVEAFPNRIIVCVAHAYALKMCAELKIPFFYRYAVTSFQEIRALKELGAAYIVVAPPLFFQLDKVKAFGIPIRVCPNKGGDLGILSANFAHDSWILPKEIDEYEDYIDTLYFVGKTPDAEATLYKIYSKDKRWLASLDIIIPDCPPDTFESGIIEPIAPRRIKCGQVCEIDSRCHFCENALKTANGATLRYYNAQKEKS